MHPEAIQLETLRQKIEDGLHFRAFLDLACELAPGIAQRKAGLVKRPVGAFQPRDRRVVELSIDQVLNGE